MKRLNKHYWVDVWSSPDDGGYYAECINEHGQTVGFTDVYDTRHEAAQAAWETWAQEDKDEAL